MWPLILHNDLPKVIRGHWPWLTPCILGWIEKHFFGTCNVLLYKKSSYDTKTLYTKFELGLWGVRMGAKSLKFWKYCRGQKNKIFIFLSFWGQKDSPGWEDFKSGLKIVIGQYLTPFSVKTQSKSGKFGYFVSFDSFDSLFAKKGVKCHPISILRQDLESSHPNETFWPPNESKLEKIILAPYSISKTFNDLAPILQLTDRAQISYKVFWYHKTTF